jgi:hypothetical protein
LSARRIKPALALSLNTAQQGPRRSANQDVEGGCGQLRYRPPTMPIKQACH